MSPQGQELSLALLSESVQAGPLALKSRFQAVQARVQVGQLALVLLLKKWMRYQVYRGRLRVFDHFRYQFVRVTIFVLML